ncbi:MAG: glutathione S-transferase family protein [Bradymonadia bacterium]
MHAPIRLHRHALSGHAHRVQLALSLMGIDYTLVDVDLAAGAHKQPAFLTLNPMGQVPVIEDGDQVIADSNAILVYLAERYDTEGLWYPTAPTARAQVQRWLSIAAGELKRGPADARLVTVFGAGLDHKGAIATAHRLFTMLEAHLGDRTYLVGERASLADIALYSYTAHAPEGAVDLSPYPGIRRWLATVETLEGFVPMKKTAVALAA